MKSCFKIISIIKTSFFLPGIAVVVDLEIAVGADPEIVAEVDLGTAVVVALEHVAVAGPGIAVVVVPGTVVVVPEIVVEGVVAVAPAGIAVD